MGASQLSGFVQHLRVVLQERPLLTDADLLERFTSLHEESALATLVHRHAAMVWGVCRRVLNNHHDIEDAFQATFLVLVRKAALIRPRDKVANWLYGVAYQTAVRARATSAKQRFREKQVVCMPEVEIDRHEPRDDFRPALHQQINRLPAKYRVLIVLCDLEGKTRKEAAQQLAVPEGTVAGRLARARAMLGKRLARQGIVISAGGLSAALGQHASAAGLPASLVTSTIRAASSFAATSSAKGIVGIKVVALTEGVLKLMWLNKIKNAAVGMMIIFGIAALGTAGVVSGSRAEPQEAGDARQKITELTDKLQVEEKAHERRVRNLKTQIAELEREARRSNMHSIDPQRFLAEHFKYKVPVEVGETSNTEGYRIEILEVLGTQPRIQIGGNYIVRGRYVMPSPRRATIYFHESANGPNGVGPDMDLQRTTVDQAEGEFTLMHAMRGSNAGAPAGTFTGFAAGDLLTKYGTSGPGFFHLHLVTEGREFADMYFGTGDNVMRKKEPPNSKEDKIRPPGY
jgi:RNA polymerase sigma factor (sigma-70 family)